MYLKALEIQGFKSFPDKTVLRFDSDITAIVGPNGSGKSNISDAVSWVLGEQSSRALRGAKMEDVIFGGTPRRSQLGFAEVSLILDNQDGALGREESEIMVTRRYYRSGEGEYYINRQTARLRDINEMFMDTGLGREGYSNIGQGRIDEILSVKGQDRREIFEEAAGISRYRHRREETERRLAHTEENLLRIRDRIAELELQVEPLREQAEKAKAWLHCRDELRRMEVTVWLDSLQQLEQSLLTLRQDRQTAEEQLQKTRDDLDAAYSRADVLSAAMQSSDRRAEELRGRISAAQEERQKCMADAAVLRTRYENNLASMDRIRQELADQQSRSGSLTEQIADRQARILELQAERAELTQTLEQVRMEGQALSRSADASGADLQQLQQAQTDTQAQTAEKKTELSAVSALVQELLDRQTGSERDRADLRSRLAEAQQHGTQYALELEQAEEEAVSLRNTTAGYGLRLQNRTGKRDALQKQLQELEVELRTLASRVKLFQDMERSYEGFSKAVKTVMQESRRGLLRNIHGPVSRLLQTDEEYAAAIETALGSSAQSVVVSTEEDGRAAIALLKQRDAGRATFLPVSAIRGRPLQERGLESCAGFAGIASDLIRCEEIYREIFVNLLGRTVIVRSLDDAIAMARRYGHRFRIVTLDGQVMNAGGSMTGGSAGRTAGMITRAGELQRMLVLQQSQQEQKQQVEQALKEAQRAVDEAEIERTAARDRLRQLEDRILRLQGDAGRQETLTAALTASIEAADADLLALQGRLDEGRVRIDRLQQEIEQLRAVEAAQSGQMQTITQGMDVLTGQTAAVSERLTSLRMELSALEAEEQSTADSVARLSGLAESLQGDQTQRMQLLEQSTAENTRLQTEMLALQDSGAQLEQQEAALQQELQTLLADRMQTERQKTACEKEQQNLNRELVLQERECARLEQKQNAAGLEQKQILDRMWESYELTPTLAAEVARPVESVAEARREAAALKQKLSRLGNPNPGAIEDYARVSERYEYLKGQETDVEKSRQEILELIRSVTAEMTEIFRREFDRINTCFRETFVELFGGGSAELVLEDPDDVLSCGIEIRVQPPGKQLKTLTLLSGGEKALVAIALYFAILKVRPTPFCMLDEIDAALDDRNVNRFVRYLRSLSEKTQFLVITHRRGTMEGADVLYGVTMQEQGVSRVVRMDLDRIAREMHLH